MSEVEPQDSATKRDDRPRKWGNRRPVTKRVDLSPAEAERREKERRDAQATEFLSVRMSAGEKETIRKRAMAYGMKISDFARTILLSGLKEPPPPKVDPEAVRALAFQISKLGTNMNQLAKVANETHRVQAEQTLLSLCDKCAEAIDRVIAL